MTNESIALCACCKRPADGYGFNVGSRWEPKTQWACEECFDSVKRMTELSEGQIDFVEADSMRRAFMDTARWAFEQFGVDFSGMAVAHCDEFARRLIGGYGEQMRRRFASATPENPIDFRPVSCGHVDHPANVEPEIPDAA